MTLRVEFLLVPLKSNETLRAVPKIQLRLNASDVFITLVSDRFSNNATKYLFSEKKLSCQKFRFTFFAIRCVNIQKIEIQEKKKRKLECEKLDAV